MGELSWNKSQYTDAINYCQSALQLLNQSGDIDGECRLQGVLGNTYFSLGSFDKAVDAFTKRLELARLINDKACENEALRHIGLIHGIRNQAEEALRYLDQALTIAREISDRESERQILMFIGNVHFTRTDLA